MEDTNAMRRPGRPKKDPIRHKRNRTLSMTDEEFGRLIQRAEAANRGISEYVIEALALDRDTPAPKA